MTTLSTHEDLTRCSSRCSTCRPARSVSKQSGRSTTTISRTSWLRCYGDRSPAGHKLRLLYLLGPQLRDYDGDAAQEEFKFAARHATAYERIGVVSDESWLRPALRLLSVLVPGKIRGFPVADLAEARSWVAEGLDGQGRSTTG